MDEERLVVALEARVNEFEKRMKRAERTGTRSFQNMKRSSASATASMEQSMVRSSGRINQALASTSTAVGTFGKAFAASAVAIGGAKLMQYAARSVRAVADFGDEAKRAGVSVQALQEWKFVGDQNRIGIDQIVDGLKELSLRADEFVVTGAGPAAEAFARLGFNAEDLRKSLEDPSELMLEIIGRMQDMDRAAQLRIADEIFGGTGGERFAELIGQGEAGLRATIARAHEVGAVMSEQVVAKAAEIDQRFKEITSSVSTLGKTIVVSVVDAVIETDTRLAQMFGNIEAAKAKLGEGTAEALDVNPSALKEYRFEVNEVLNAFAELDAVWAGIYERAGFEIMNASDLEVAFSLADIMDEIDAKMTAFEKGEISAAEFGQSITRLIGEAESLIGTLDAIDAARFSGVTASLGQMAATLASVRDRAIEAMQALPGAEVNMSQGPSSRPRIDGLPSENAPRSSPRPQSAPNNIDFGVPAVTGGSSGGGGGAAKVDEWKQAVTGLREEIGKLEAETIAFLAASEGGYEVGFAMDYARKRAELLTDAQKAGKAITPELTAEVDELAMAYARAAQRADQAAENMQKVEDNAKAGADALTSLFMGVLQGADGAKQAVANLLLQMAQVQLQKAFLGMSEQSGAVGFIGGMLSGTRAKGGGVQAGKAYLVNEDTARSEVFVPSTSGAVLNVPQAQSALRGGKSEVSVTLNLNTDGSVIAAIADQSAEAKVRSYAPAIVKQSVQETANAMSRSKMFGQRGRVR